MGRDDIETFVVELVNNVEGIGLTSGADVTGLEELIRKRQQSNPADNAIYFFPLKRPLLYIYAPRFVNPI